LFIIDISQYWFAKLIKNLEKTLLCIPYFFITPHLQPKNRKKGTVPFFRFRKKGSVPFFRFLLFSDKRDGSFCPIFVSATSCRLIFFQKKVNA